MDYLLKRVAYLQGLTDGFELDEESKEAKLLLEIVDVLEDIVDTIKESNEDLEEYITMVDEDLDELETYVYDDDSDFDYDDLDDFDFYDDDDFDFDSCCDDENCEGCE